MRRFIELAKLKNNSEDSRSVKRKTVSLVPREDFLGTCSSVKGSKVAPDDSGEIGGREVMSAASDAVAELNLDGNVRATSRRNSEV